MRETGKDGFKKKLKKTLVQMFPGCMIFSLDPNEQQGVPDLLILFGDRWASLEVKGSEDEDHRPNQDYYVDEMSSMSFSSFIFPENKSAVLKDLYDHLYSVEKE